MPKTVHPVVKQARMLLRPLVRARTGKRMNLFFKDKGITGIAGDPTRNPITEYFKANGLHVHTLNGRLNIPHKDGTMKGGTQGFFIELPDSLAHFISMFDNHKFPEITQI